MSYLLQIDPANLSVLIPRVIQAALLRTIHVNQTNGDIYCTFPLSGKVSVYGQSPSNPNLPLINISNIHSYGILTSPLDAKFDNANSTLWILDAGKNSVVGLNAALQIKYVVNNINMPVNMIVDKSNGDVMVRHFTSMTGGRITWLNAQGVVQKFIEYTDAFPLSNFSLSSLNQENMYWLPMPSQMSYDNARKRLWWIAQDIVYMADAYNSEIYTLDIRTTESVIDVRAIDIDMESGNAIVGCTPANNRGYSKYDVMVVINKDNNAVLMTTKVSSASPDGSNVMSSLSSVSQESSLSSANEYNVFRERLYAIFIDQTQQGVIPMVCPTSTPVKTSHGVDLPFTYNQSVNVTAIVPDTGLLPRFVPNNIASNSYVPYDGSSLYHAINPLYVDVIASNVSGYAHASLAQGVVTQSFANQTVYATPRFSWNIKAFVPSGGNLTSTTSPDILQYVTSLVGFNSNTILQVALNTKQNKVLATKVLTYQPNGMGTCGARMYLSSADTFYGYSVDTYLTSSSTYSSAINQLGKWDNAQGAIIACVNGSDILGFTATQVVRFDSDFTLLQTIDGILNAKKIIWSSYHQEYFVSTDTTLYAIGSGAPQEIYWIKNGVLVDFSIASNGNIAMIWRFTENDVLRVIDNTAQQLVNNQSYTVNSLNSVTFSDSNVVYVWQSMDSLINSDTQQYTYRGNLIYGTNTLATYKLSAQTIAPPAIATSTDVTISLLTPLANKTYAYGDTVNIQWVSNKSTSDKVSLELLKNGVLYYLIDGEANNNGDYKWIIPLTLERSTKYTIRATWLSLNPSDANSSISSLFGIADSQTAFGTTPGVSPHVVNMDWDVKSKSVVLTWSTGLVGYFDTVALNFYGLFDTGCKQFIAATPMNAIPYIYNGFNKVRVFVGSAPQLNDKWDSGEVETALSSIYYGGGNNLTGGSTYYVNIQVYTAEFGWSKVQTQIFVMPTE